MLSIELDQVRVLNLVCTAFERNRYLRQVFEDIHPATESIEEVHENV